MFDCSQGHNERRNLRSSNQSWPYQHQQHCWESHRHPRGKRFNWEKNDCKAESLFKKRTSHTHTQTHFATFQNLMWFLTHLQKPSQPSAHFLKHLDTSLIIRKHFHPFSVSLIFQHLVPFMTPTLSILKSKLAVTTPVLNRFCLNFL